MKEICMQFTFTYLTGCVLKLNVSPNSIKPIAKGSEWSLQKLISMVWKTKIVLCITTERQYGVARTQRHVLFRS